MGYAKTLSKLMLGIATVGIYVISLIVAYAFSRNYSHWWNFSLVFGVIIIILCGEWCVWLLFLLYHRFFKPKKKTVPEPSDEEKKTPAAQLTTKKKEDRKLQKNYLAVLAEYKRDLPPHEYKKFQEDTKYDILLYDAIMVSKDKQGTLLEKIRQDKGELYASAIQKILG